MPPPVSRWIPSLQFREAAGPQTGRREVPEETPVALVHDAATTAVMMATPADLEDFGWGFTLTERLVQRASDIRSVEVAESELGIEVRVWLAAGSGADLAKRRRTLAGPTGCGLCGVESLAEAVRPPAAVACQMRVDAARLREAVASLAPAQALGAATRAAHAAAWWTPDEGLLTIREDVGRHNALDKLVGALVRAERPPLGVLLLTSRVSVEMVQKATVFGAEIIAAVSAPTALAVRTAEAAGITLAAVARPDGFEVFTSPERILGA